MISYTTSVVLVPLLPLVLFADLLFCNIKEITTIKHLILLFKCRLGNSVMLFSIISIVVLMKPGKHNTPHVAAYLILCWKR